MSDVAPDIIRLLKTYSKTQERKSTNMDIAMWNLPEGIAANKSNMLTERMQHYRFKQTHTLGDGTRVVPTLETLRHIFDAFDMFQLPVAISEGTYTVYVND